LFHKSAQVERQHPDSHHRHGRTGPHRRLPASLDGPGRCVRGGRSDRGWVPALPGTPTTADPGDSAPAAVATAAHLVLVALSLDNGRSSPRSAAVLGRNWADESTDRRAWRGPLVLVAAQPSMHRLGGIPPKRDGTWTIGMHRGSPQACTACTLAPRHSAPPTCRGCRGSGGASVNISRSRVTHHPQPMCQASGGTKHRVWWAPGDSNPEPAD
jgi:hypothetical protein